MPNWKKVIVSGSDATLNSIYVVNSVTASIFSGSFTGSLEGTASWALNAITASYALNASGGGLSALYIQDEGITQGTASYINFTGTGVTATVSNSTASINITGGGGGGGALTYHQTSSAVTWNVSHSFNTYTPIVQVYDEDYNQLVPSSVSGSSLTTVQITFATATAGYAVITTGGLTITGSNAFLFQSTPATTWSFYHGLNETYPVFTIFDSNDDVIVPLRIHAENANTASIYFSTARTGTAVAANCGLSGSTFESASWAAYAVSSSYAANADLLDGKDSTIFATTGSNIFKGLQTINGNLFMSGSFPLIYNNDATNNMLFGMFDGSSIYGPYYQLFGNNYPNIIQRGGAEFVYDIRNNPNADFHIASFNGSTWTTKFVVNDSGSQITGSLGVTGGITGSLFGTASWAQNALTSSNIQGGLATYVPLWNTNTSLTSSYLIQSGNILKTRYNNVDKGLSLDFNFDSYILGNPSAGNNTYLQVFDGGSVINVYSPSYTYFNDKVGVRIIPTNPGLAVSGSFEVTGPGTSKFMNTNVQITGALDVTGGITGSLHGTASWAQNAITSSYTLNALSASYALSSSHAITASFALTASSALNASDILIYVKNSTGAQINKGTVVRIAGAVGDNPLISTASYTDDNNSANTLGITNENIPNDSFGYVMTEGKLLGIDTSIYSVGQLLYLGANGALTGSAPQAPLHSVRLGQVLRVQLNNGSMYVRIDNGYELGELHDIRDTSTTASFGDLLVKSGSVWHNSRQLTGSYGLTGSLNATSITSSLFGTSSWAVNAITSSYPFTVTGSTIRSFNTSNVNTSNALFIGANAGGSAAGASNSIFLGQSAGSGSTNASTSNFIGQSAGRLATGAFSSNFLGFSAGDSATNAYYSNFIGEYSGFSAANAANSNFLGWFAGTSAVSASDSNFIGQNAGASATFASGSNFIGYFAGLSAASASLSTLIGYNVGRANTFAGVATIGPNNIIIGTNITLETLRRDSINLGGLLFGTGSYSTITGNPFSGSVNGRIGINQPLPVYSLDVSGSGNFTNGLTVTGSFQATSLTGSLQVTGNSTYSGSQTFTNGFIVLTQVSQSLDFINDAAAAAGGVPLGGLYRNGNFIAIRIS